MSHGGIDMTETVFPVTADLNDHDRVRALGPLLPLGGVRGGGARVGPQDQDVDGRFLAGRHLLLRGTRSNTHEGIGDGLNAGGDGVAHPQSEASCGQGQNQEDRQDTEEGDPPSSSGAASSTAYAAHRGRFSL